MLISAVVLFCRWALCADAVGLLGQRPGNRLLGIFGKCWLESWGRPPPHILCTGHWCPQVSGPDNRSAGWWHHFCHSPPDNGHAWFHMWGIPIQFKQLKQPILVIVGKIGIPLAWQSFLGLPGMIWVGVGVQYHQDQAQLLAQWLVWGWLWTTKLLWP